MIAKILYDSEMSSIANFGTVPSYCFIASCGYYSHYTVPFLQALIFFIPDLLKLIKKPYEIDGNQPDFVMIGLTR